jgi:cytoskeletal protein RodZ
MPASDRDEALRELGRMARERREDVGISLEDIFERTRVRVEYLRAIEQGTYRGFPDLVYIKGFVRTYLGVIGAEDLKEEFMSWLNKEPAKDRWLPPTNVLGNTPYPTKGFKPASHFWLFAVLLLVLAGSGWYVWYSWNNNPLNRSFVITPELASTDEKSADLPTFLSHDSSHLSIIPASLSVLSREAPPPQRTAPFLHIKANTDVWIRVTIADKIVYTNTLTAGKDASWDLTARGKVTYGRSNAATVILNGRELRNANAKGTYFYEPDGTFRKVQ